MEENRIEISDFVANEARLMVDLSTEQLDYIAQQVVKNIMTKGILLTIKEKE